MTRTQILARTLLVAVKAAGMVVETPKSSSELLGSLIWNLRKTIHREMSGRMLLDWGSTIQIGPDEVHASIISLPGTFARYNDWEQGPLAEDKHNVLRAMPAWICGPKAVWIAHGTALQFFHATRNWAGMNA